MRHVLFAITSASRIGPHARPTGYFFSEVAHPWYAFERAGVAVDFASIEGGAPPHDGYDDDDEIQRAFRLDHAFRRLENSRRLASVDVTSYDAVVVPGGLGPMVDMAERPEFERQLGRAYDAGLVVGAVCHGPAALLGVELEGGRSLIEGRRLTSFSNAEEEGYAKADVPFLLQTALEQAGASFSAADPWQPHVVVDERLVTGQNPASAGPMAEAIIRLIEGKGA